MRGVVIDGCQKSDSCSVATNPATKGRTISLDGVTGMKAGTKSHGGRPAEGPLASQADANLGSAWRERGARSCLLSLDWTARTKAD